LWYALSLRDAPQHHSEFGPQPRPVFAAGDVLLGSFGRRGVFQDPVVFGDAKPKGHQGSVLVQKIEAHGVSPVAERHGSFLETNLAPWRQAMANRPSNPRQWRVKSAMLKRVCLRSEIKPLMSEWIS
jgi:hypothetical protein